VHPWAVSPLLFILALFGTSVVTGVLGAVLGLGGGTLLVPILTMFFGINLHYAMGASLVSVIATSSGAAAGLLKLGLSNIRVGLFFAVPTIVGAMVGSTLVGIAPPWVIELVFGLAIGWAGLLTFRQPSGARRHVTETDADPLAVSCALEGAYYDNALGCDVAYRAERVKRGAGAMFGAGVLSGLLGIGAGAFTVLAMDVFLRLPIKVAAATSSFMIGITAAASAAIFFARGDVHPLIAGPVAIGVLVGAIVGSRVLPRLTNSAIRRLFLVVVFYLSASMILRAFGVRLF
jgi:uncharacterized membrane protein YfcA